MTYFTVVRLGKSSPLFCGATCRDWHFSAAQSLSLHVRCRMNNRPTVKCANPAFLTHSGHCRRDLSNARRKFTSCEALARENEARRRTVR